MNFKEIQELIRLVGKSELSEFKMKDGEFELTIKTQRAGKFQEGVQSVSYLPVAAPISVPSAPLNQNKANTENTPAPSASRTLLRIKLKLNLPWLGHSIDLVHRTNLLI